MNIEKKFCLLIVLIVILVFSSLNAYAVKYETEQYEIDIPENYAEINNNEMPLFINMTSNFSILVKENENSTNILDFTEEQIKSMESEIDKALEKANMPNEMLGYEFVKVKNNDALLIKNKCKKSPEDEEYIYQYKYILTGENYIYYITYSTSVEEDIEYFKDILETFETKDKIFEIKSEEKNKENIESTVNNDLTYIIVILVIIALILMVVVVIVIIKLRR